MNKLGFIYAILAAVLWGLVYAIDQKILEKVSPINLLIIDSLIVVVISPLLFLLNDQPMREVLNSGRFNLGLIFIVAILVVLANLFILSGIKILGASTASIFEIAYPPFVVLFCFLFFKESLSVYFYLGAAFIFIGSLIIVKFA